jgi:hypothetical protein
MAAKYLYTKKYTLNLLTTVSKHAKNRPINGATYEFKIMTGRHHAKNLNFTLTQATNDPPHTRFRALTGTHLTRSPAQNYAGQADGSWVLAYMRN